MTLVAGDAGLRSVVWPNERPGRVAPLPGPVFAARHPVLDAALVQLRQYFAGQRQTFELPLDHERGSGQAPLTGLAPRP